MRSKMQEFNYTLSPNSRRKQIGSGERRSDMQIALHFGALICRLHFDFDAVEKTSH